MSAPTARVASYSSQWVRSEIIIIIIVVVVVLISSRTQ